MAQRVVPHVSGVAETLLLPLYARARESVRPDGVMHDTQAERIVARLDHDFRRLALRDFHQATRVMGTRELDRIAREFLIRHPRGVVVHLGCGLDTRFERVDNGRVTWFDLDLPEVVELRRELGLAVVPGEVGDRYHLIGGSVLDDTCLAGIGVHGDAPVLVLAEGLLSFFLVEQVRRLVVVLASRFPGAELAFDAFMPWALGIGNLQLRLMGLTAPMHWGLRRPTDVLGWCEGIQLLQAWYYLDEPEPRLRGYLWLRHIPGVRHFAGVFHYRLGPSP